MPNDTGVRTDGYVPMPETCHPHYQSQAEAIRNGGLGHPTLQVMEPRRLQATFDAQPLAYDVAPDVTTLTVRKCAGPAPFIGDARWQRGMYEWKVAMDNLGRHVAGPATLFIEEHWDPRLTGSP